MDFDRRRKEEGGKKLARNARMDRRRRKREKMLRVSAIRVQSVFRGNRARRKVSLSFRAEFDKKSRDLSTLISMLRNKGVNFEPPATLLVGLAKLLVFFFEKRVSEDGTKRLNFVSTLFILSIHSKKTDTNVMCCDQTGRFWERLLRLCLENIVDIKACTQLCISVASESEIGVKSEVTRALARTNLTFLRSRLQLVRTILLKSIEIRYATLERSRLVMDDAKSNAQLSKFLSLMLNQKDFLSSILTVPGVANDFTNKLCSELIMSSSLVHRVSLEMLYSVPATSKFHLPIEKGGSAAYLLGNLIHMWMRSRRKHVMNDSSYLVCVYSLAKSLPSDVFSRGGAHVIVKQNTTCRAVRLASVLTRQLEMLASETHVKDIVRSSLSHYDSRAKNLVKEDLSRQGEIISSKYVDEMKKRKETPRWNWLSRGSQWAQNLFASKKKKKKRNMLKNVSSESRKIAREGNQQTSFSTNSSSVVVKPKRDVKEDHEIVRALCELCLLMIRRGDETHEEDENVRGHVMLSFLCFSTPVVRHLWAYISDSRAKKDSSNVQSCVVELFCRLLSHELLVVDDVEWMESGVPLPIRTFDTLISILKPLVLKHVTSEIVDHNSVLYAATGLLRHTYDRLAHIKLRGSIPIISPTQWLAPSSSRKKWSAAGTCWVYTHAFFLVPFEERLRRFESMVSRDRSNHQPKGEPPVHRIAIRRSAIFEDAFRALSDTTRSLRYRVGVTFLSHGRAEAGLDAGGLFKDLWTELSAVAFNPNYGLLKQTVKGEYLYPNPASKMIHGDVHLSYVSIQFRKKKRKRFRSYSESRTSRSKCTINRYFKLLGRIVGKALYEGLTIQPKFARFVLRRMLGKNNGLNELKSLDEELYKNLLFLKGYKGDVEDDLCLDFTVTHDLFGKTHSVELIPGGSKMPVTCSNRVRFVLLNAHYHLNVTTKDQTEAFLRGFRELIDMKWLSMFSEPELQLLISGEDKPLDVNDLRKHSQLKGFYSTSSTVRRFWRVLKGFEVSHQKQLLRFVTSCERAPRLGFASLNPPFCLQCVSISKDDERLPTAATCFNTLKLPTYSSEKVMREKLIRAITSGTGFELA